ncbi:hypothetical protein FQA47_006852, partial [Oryzias melastigma]
MMFYQMTGQNFQWELEEDSEPRRLPGLAWHNSATPPAFSLILSPCFIIRKSAPAGRRCPC